MILFYLLCAAGIALGVCIITMSVFSQRELKELDAQYQKTHQSIMDILNERTNKWN